MVYDSDMWYIMIFNMLHGDKSWHMMVNDSKWWCIKYGKLTHNLGNSQQSRLPYCQQYPGVYLHV